MVPVGLDPGHLEERLLAGPAVALEGRGDEDDLAPGAIREVDPQGARVRLALVVPPGGEPRGREGEQGRLLRDLLLNGHGDEHFPDATATLLGNTSGDV